MRTERAIILVLVLKYSQTPMETWGPSDWRYDGYADLRKPIYM